MRPKTIREVWLVLEPQQSVPCISCHSPFELISTLYWECKDTAMCYPGLQTLYSFPLSRILIQKYLSNDFRIWGILKAFSSDSKKYTMGLKKIIYLSLPFDFLKSTLNFSLEHFAFLSSFLLSFRNSFYVCLPY